MYESFNIEIIMLDRTSEVKLFCDLHISIILFIKCAVKALIITDSAESGIRKHWIYCLTRLFSFTVLYSLTTKKQEVRAFFFFCKHKLWFQFRLERMRFKMKCKKSWLPVFTLLYSLTVEKTTSQRMVRSQRMWQKTKCN